MHCEKAGSLVVSYVTKPFATWSCLILLLSIHLAMNHAAVRAVKLRVLNRQRANIVLSNVLQKGRILSPDEVSTQERIFEWDGVLRWVDSEIIGRAEIGVTLQRLLSIVAPESVHHATGATSDHDQVLQRLIQIHGNEDFFIWWDFRRHLALIVLKQSSTPRTQLKAWATVLTIAHRQHSTMEGTTSPNDESVINVIQESSKHVNDHWDDWSKRIEEAGFNIDVSGLETRPSSRIRFVPPGDPDDLHARKKDQ